MTRWDISSFKEINECTFKYQANYKCQRYCFCHFACNYLLKHSLCSFRFDSCHSDNAHMLQHSIVHFSYMNNSLSKNLWKNVCTCNVHTWGNQLVRRIVQYIWDDTHYRGPSPTLKDQRGLFLEIFNPLLVGIPNKSAVGLHSLKDEVIQFWSHPPSLLFPWI